MYKGPAEGENERMHAGEEKKAEVQGERHELIEQFEKLSIEWAKLEPGSAEATRKYADRRKLAEKLGQSYWTLEPYVRARTYYHRVGVIDASGKVDYKAAK